MALITLPPDPKPGMAVTRLHLAGNALMTLPSALFTSCRGLRFLDLSDNRLESLPASIAGATELRELYLRGNNLTLVGREVGQLTKLEVLDLAKNKMGVIGLDSNNFDLSLRRLTDPLVNANLMMESKVNTMLNQRKAVLGASEEDRGRAAVLPEMESGFSDDDFMSPPPVDGPRKVQFGDVEVIDSNSPQPSGRQTIVTSSNRPIKRSSLPEMNSPTVPTLHRRSSDDSLGLAVTNTNNPGHVHLQRLLSFLADLHDLDPRIALLRGGGGAVQVLDPRVDRTSSPNPGIGDDPDAPGLSEKDREKILKRQSPARRANIVAEVLATERTYVKELQGLVEVYVAQLEKSDILTPADLSFMFSNVTSILLFHQSHLLPELEKAAANPTQPLGSVFLKCAPFFKMYSVYYNNFDAANHFAVTLEQLASSSSSSSSSRPASSMPASASQNLATLLQNSTLGTSNSNRRAVARRFKAFIKQARTHPSHTQISLQAFLILPVQRLPRYRLLVDQLLESTPLSHPDRAHLDSAAVAVRDRVAECNDRKREMEEVERGLTIMQRVKVKEAHSVGGGRFAHVRMGRRFVKEGAWRVVKVVELREEHQGRGRVDALFAAGGRRDRFFTTSVGPVIETRFVVGGSTSVGPGASALASPGGPPVGVVDTPPGGGSDGLAVYGLQRTSGRDFWVFVFSDVLCWCKPSPGGDGDFELIRAFEVGPGSRCTVEMMMVLPESAGGPASPVVMDPAPAKGRFRNSMFPQAGSVTSVASHRMSQLPSPAGSTSSVGSLEPEAVMRFSDGECIMYVRGLADDIEGWVETIKGLGAAR
ncbi:hypothetical protein HK101_004026 [Irineochytrium annulatum]|nr:hypothetical protein HK101_004026 [Irineochytrium annulatum]